MIILFIIAIPILTLIIWMLVRRKWKALLWILGCSILLIIAGWYLFLHTVSEAFGAKCEDNRKWKIEEYVIIEKQCIGFAGPLYYPVYLFKDNKEIDKLLFINDSTCLVNFITDKGDTLTFDICEKKLK